MLLCGYNSIQLKKPIRHEKRCYSEGDQKLSKINLQRGILTVKNRRSREKKRICAYRLGLKARIYFVLEFDLEAIMSVSVDLK